MSVKFLIDFLYQRSHKLKSQNSLRSIPHELTKQNHAKEISGECLVPDSFERLHRVACARFGISV